MSLSRPSTPFTGQSAHALVDLSQILLSPFRIMDTIANRQEFEKRHFTHHANINHSMGAVCKIVLSMAYRSSEIESDSQPRDTANTIIREVPSLPRKDARRYGH